MLEFPPSVAEVEGDWLEVEGEAEVARGESQHVVEVQSINPHERVAELGFAVIGDAHVNEEHVEGTQQVVGSQRPLLQTLV
jgi:hypothetical protein